MSMESHKGEILPLANRTIPLSSSTVFHANFEKDKLGYGKTGYVRPRGYEKSGYLDGTVSADLEIGKGTSSTGITIECWAKPASIGSNTILFGSTDGTNQRMHVGVFTGKWSLGIQESDMSVEPLSGDAGNANPSRWDHIALVITATSATLYVNAVVAVTKTITKFTFAENLFLGKGGSFGSPFVGSVNGLKIWRESKSINDLLWNQDEDLDGNEESLIGYWKMNEGEGQVLSSSCPLSNDIFVGPNMKWKEGRIVSQEGIGKFSKGIIIEPETKNLARNGDFRLYHKTYDPGWDVALNGNSVASYWGGYNSGVTNPSQGYHAHLNTTKFPYPVYEFIDKNSEIGSLNRWLGISQQFSTDYRTLGWVKGSKVTVSFDIYSDTAGKQTSFGLYHKMENGTYALTGSTSVQDIRSINEWIRISATFEINSDASPWAADGSVALYIYSYFGPEGITWIKNIQIETQGMGTSFAIEGRGRPELKYPCEILRKEKGTISFWAKYNSSPSRWGAGSINSFLFHTNEQHLESDYMLYKNTFSFGRKTQDENNLVLLLSNKAGTRWEKTIPMQADLNWHYYVVTWDQVGNRIGVYIDGVQVVYEGPTVWFDEIKDNIDFCIGSGYPEAVNQGVSNVTISEVRIDDVAMGDEEIQSWYYANSPFLPNRPETRLR